MDLSNLRKSMFENILKKKKKNIRSKFDKSNTKVKQKTKAKHLC